MGPPAPIVLNSKMMLLKTTSTVGSAHRLLRSLRGEASWPVGPFPRPRRGLPRLASPIYPPILLRKIPGGFAPSLLGRSLRDLPRRFTPFEGDLRSPSDSPRRPTVVFLILRKTPSASASKAPLLPSAGGPCEPYDRSRERAERSFGPLWLARSLDSMSSFGAVPSGLLLSRTGDVRPMVRAFGPNL